MQAKTLKGYADQMAALAMEMQRKSWDGETCAEEDAAGDLAVLLTEELAGKLARMARHAAECAKRSLAETR